jgi:hypothetical protein
MSPASILALVTGCLFVVTGGVKVVGLRQSLDIRDHFGMAPRLWRTVGLLETAGAVGVLVGTAVTPLGVLALVGLAALMLGAIASRLRVHDPVPLVLGDVVVLALVVVTAAALLSR